MVGHVATDLRSLVYWRGRYSPLLLRIAGRFDLPLPVYYVPNHPPGALSVQPESHLIGTKGSLFREFEAQVIGDLQDWLEAPAIATPAGVQRQLSVIGAIKEMASTLGSAHYDLDVPIALESLYSFSGPASDELTALIGSAATVVHALSDYVLLEVKSRLDAA